MILFCGISLIFFILNVMKKQRDVLKYLERSLFSSLLLIGMFSTKVNIIFLLVYVLGQYFFVKDKHQNKLDIVIYFFLGSMYFVFDNIALFVSLMIFLFIILKLEKGSSLTLFHLTFLLTFSFIPSGPLATLLSIFFLISLFVLNNESLRKDHLLLISLVLLEFSLLQMDKAVPSLNENTGIFLLISFFVLSSCFLTSSINNIKGNNLICIFTLIYFYKGVDWGVIMVMIFLLHEYLYNILSSYILRVERLEKFKQYVKHVSFIGLNFTSLIVFFIFNENIIYLKYIIIFFLVFKNIFLFKMYKEMHDFKFLGFLFFFFILGFPMILPFQEFSLSFLGLPRKMGVSLNGNSLEIVYFILLILFIKFTIWKLYEKYPKKIELLSFKMNFYSELLVRRYYSLLKNMSLAFVFSGRENRSNSQKNKSDLNVEISSPLPLIGLILFILIILLIAVDKL